MIKEYVTLPEVVVVRATTAMTGWFSSVDSNEPMQAKLDRTAGALEALLAALNEARAVRQAESKAVEAALEWLEAEQAFAEPDCGDRRCSDCDVTRARQRVIDDLREALKREAK